MGDIAREIIACAVLNEVSLNICHDCKNLFM